MPRCILQHPETKDFVPFLEAAEEAGEGRSRETHSWGMAFEIVERNSFRPNRIMFIFSAVPFTIIHSPPPSICMKLKIVAIFFREIMFLKSVFGRVLSDSVKTLL